MRASIRGYLTPWALMLSALWLLPILAMRAQQHDDSALRSSLPATACASPCFMDIQPGETSRVALLETLAAHPWVEPQSYLGDSASNNVLTWQWSAAAPAWIDRDTPGMVGLSNGRVRTLVVVTAIQWGEFVLAFGRPDAYRQISLYDGLTADRLYDYEDQGWYADWGLLMVSSDRRCWKSNMFATVYHWPIRLQFQDQTPDLSPVARPRITQAQCK